MSSDLWRQWQALFATPGSTPGPFPGFAGPGFAGFAGPGFTGPGSASAGPLPPGFAPFADAGARFATALQEFLRGATPNTQASPGAAAESARAAAEQFNDFLRDQFAGFFRPPGSADPTGAPPSAAAHSQAPALGPAREQILRGQRAFAAWNRLIQAQGRLQRMGSDALRNAATTFTSQLKAAAGAPPTAEAIDRLYDQWIDNAEKAYASTAHSEAFTDALAEQVNATAEWRRESIAGIEDWAKFWDLPTRSEINSLTLRLRDLEKQLATAKASRPKPTPAAKSPRRSAQSKAKAKAKQKTKQGASGPKRNR